MRGMNIARLVVMSVTCLFSWVVLGANAGYLGITFSAKVDDEFGFRILPATSPDPFAVLNIFVALLTLVLVKPMLIIDFCRQGAFTSFIVVELSVLGFLNIFWLVSAAWTTNINSSISGFCSVNTDISAISSMCAVVQVSLAFSWLNWIMLLAYIATLLTFSIIYANQGKPIWKKSVRFVVRAHAQPAPVGKQASYSSTPAASLTQATPTPPPEQVSSQQQMQFHMPSHMQPQAQQYGGALYPLKQTGMAHGASPLRAEI